MDKPPLSISGLAQPSAPELPVSEHTPRQIGGAGSIPLPPNRSPSSLSAAVSGPFRSLIAQKEKELHDINEYRLQTIEETLRKREASEAAIRKKFNDLKADFVFNLRLIEERDRELDKYESTCEKLKAYVREREKEIAQLRLERTNMSSKLGRRDDEAARREVEFQQEIKALSSQIESMRWESEQASSTHASRIVALESQFEQEKREHAKTLSVHEESLRAESKRAIEAADARMDAALASHDRQKRELERRVLELQTLMSKEAERASAQARVVEELRESKTKAESHAKKVNWELSDKIEAKEREVQELISEQKELKEKNKTVLDNYEKQMTELLSSLHTVESAFREQREQYELQLRQQASSREEELRRVGHRLRSQLESAEDQAKLANRARDELKQQLAKREQQEAERIRDLQRELEASKASSSVEIEKLQQELRDSNAKLWSAQSEVKHAQDSSATQREAVERYKAEAKSARDEVQRGLSREGELKREMAALNANWQQRWEKDRAAMTERHNNLTSVLQKQRDHLEGEVRKLEDRASELEEQLHVSRDSTRLARAEVRTREVEIEKMKGEAEKREREQAEEEAERRAGERNRAEQKHLRRETEDAGRSLSPKMAEDSKFEPFATQVDDDDEILAPASPLRPLALGLDDYLDGPARSASDEKLVQENSKLRAAVSVMAREMEEIRAKDRLAAIAAVNAGNAAGGSVHISRRGSVDINLGQDDGGVIDTASGMNEGSSSPLAEKLKDAENDVEKLIEERERLMEVSNRLRADLNHAMSASLEEEKIGSVIKKVKLDTSRRYEAKISKIEGRMQELISHNQALTSELAKWTIDDNMFEDEGGFSPGPNEMLGTLDFGMTDQSENHVEDDSSSVDESFKNLDTESNKYGRNPTEDSSKKRDSKPSFQASIPSTSNARARLQQVRDSLELVASKPILHASRPVSKKNKAASSRNNTKTKRRQKSTTDTGRSTSRRGN